MGLSTGESWKSNSVGYVLEDLQILYLCVKFMEFEQP